MAEYFVVRIRTIFVVVLTQEWIGPVVMGVNAPATPTTVTASTPAVISATSFPVRPAVIGSEAISALSVCRTHLAVMGEMREIRLPRMVRWLMSGNDGSIGPWQTVPSAQASSRRARSRAGPRR